MRIVRPLAAMAACTALMGVAACATPSRPDAMTLSATTGLTAGAGDVGYRSVATVNVSGGSDTNPMWTAQVSNAAFKTALEASLANAGYLGTEGRPLTVTANMVDLKQPLMGLSLSVTSQVQYSVTRDSEVIFNELIAATGSAGVSEAFSANERLRLANEKSIKENIKQFLERFRTTAR